MARPEYQGRTLTLYFGSQEELKALEDAAQGAGVKASAYVIETLRRSKEFTLDHQETDSEMLMDTLERSGQQLQKCMEQIENQRETLKRREAEIAQIKADRERITLACRDIIKLLRSGGAFSNTKIVSMLGVEMGDPASMQVIRQALYLLKDMGLVDEGIQGWRWVITKENFTASKENRFNIR